MLLLILFIIELFRESNFVQEREDQADVLQNYRIQLRDRDQLIEELRNKIKNIPERIKINTNSVVRQVRLPVDTKERNDLHDEIDNLTVKNLRLTEEFEKLQKESEQDIKLARWDEKKASEAKFKENVTHYYTLRCSVVYNII